MQPNLMKNKETIEVDNSKGKPVEPQSKASKSNKILQPKGILKNVEMVQPSDGDCFGLTIAEKLLVPVIDANPNSTTDEKHDNDVELSRISDLELDDFSSILKEIASVETHNTGLQKLVTFDTPNLNPVSMSVTGELPLELGRFPKFSFTMAIFSKNAKQNWGRIKPLELPCMGDVKLPHLDEHLVDD
ncbi:hypothetical protein ACH5RR_040953 [Cinchona calisaya]|uniref:Uncharacterized protein n=1 Tax=Cinchona calisaya TaxID=153742 RepID=A0ABD2XUR8_9GENT